MRRPSPLLARALPAVVAWCGACGGEAPPALRTAKAERSRIERIVVATGTIEPQKEVEVRPRIPGIVEKILVTEGQAVDKGQLLVEIERELLAAQVREAEASRDAANVERRFAAAELERARQLVASKAKSEQHLDDMQARFDGAVARVAKAEAALSNLATQLSYAHIVSPLAGRVLDIPVEEGNAVAPVTAVTGGSLLLSIAGNDALHLDGLVDENEIARVAIGQPARIRTEAYAGRVFEGRVREIKPVGERVQNVTYFRVEIEVTDRDAAQLQPRMSGDADIVTEVVDDAVTVPETALAYRGDEVLVHCPNGDGASDERPVKIGIVDGARVQVLDGLASGDVVVLP
ncbi:MAG TPA: efflux RND transporter periplasmic adaptor subunit [Myxococcota bacterium]|nr:efflux RND transporter periplasmic adaptor subunit [Myxococcota bacterium]